MKTDKFVATLIITALLLLSATPAIGVSAFINDDGENYVGSLLMLAKDLEQTSSYCGTTFDEYKGVIICGKKSKVVVAGIEQGAPRDPGNRWAVISQVSCDGKLILTIGKIARGGGGAYTPCFDNDI